MKFLVLLVTAFLQLPAAANPRTAWFEDARFGMFIHFGLYSIPAGVWDGKRMTCNDYAEWIRMQHDWPKPGGARPPWPEQAGDPPLPRPTPFPQPAWGRLTITTMPDGKQRLHAFVYDPKPGATLVLAGPATPPASGALLETQEAVGIASVAGGFSFTLPAALPDDNIAVIVFQTFSP